MQRAADGAGIELACLREHPVGVERGEGLHHRFSIGDAFDAGERIGFRAEGALRQLFCGGDGGEGMKCAHVDWVSGLTGNAPGPVQVGMPGIVAGFVTSCSRRNVYSITCLG